MHTSDRNHVGVRVRFKKNTAVWSLRRAQTAALGKPFRAREEVFEAWESIRPQAPNSTIWPQLLSRFTNTFVGLISTLDSRPNSDAVSGQPRRGTPPQPCPRVRCGFRLSESPSGLPEWHPLGLHPTPELRLESVRSFRRFVGPNRFSWNGPVAPRLHHPCRSESL